MLTLRLVSPTSLRKIRNGGPRWIYLGKGPSLRSACESLLGASNRLDVTERFHRISLELRQPFVDFVAEVGARQEDRLAWFASSFAWKDPDASDLFLLLCYLKLIESLATDPISGERLLVLIEDRWLYAQCRRSLWNLSGIAFGSTSYLFGEKAVAAIRAVAGRAVWMLAMIREYFRHARNAGRYRFSRRHTCWLYSLPHTRCFVGDRGWNDPFFGRLDAILTDSGESVGRLIPIDPVGFARQLAMRADSVHPMILELTAGRLFRSAFAFWRPASEAVPRIEGLDVSLLAAREWWTDFRRPLWSHHRLFYECALEGMRKYRPAVVIFPYENQPWEKMLVSAARAAGVGTIGYQHSTVPKFLLAYFLGRGEADRAPLPDVIVSTGTQQSRLLVEGGTPASRVRVGGSLRYEHFGQTPAVRRRGSREAATRVLVVVAHDRSLSSSLLDAIERVFPDHGEAEGLSFFFRPHPTLPLAHAAISWMTMVEGDLAPQLSTFDVVVTTGTTVGLEACFLGIPVVKFQGDVLLDLDPLDALPEGTFLSAAAPQLRERILQAAVPGCGEAPPATLVGEMFPGVADHVWVSAVADLKNRAACATVPREGSTLSRSA